MARMRAAIDDGNVSTHFGTRCWPFGGDMPNAPSWWLAFPVGYQRSFPSIVENWIPIMHVLSIVAA